MRPEYVHEEYRRRKDWRRYWRYVKMYRIDILGRAMFRYKKDIEAMEDRLVFEAMNDKSY